MKTDLPDSPLPVTTCALLYGKYLDLAKRCLGPLFESVERGLITDLRIFGNSVHVDTLSWVEEEIDRRRISPNTLRIWSETNIKKYPAMRQLFAAAPLNPWTMWFDDDSYIYDLSSFWCQLKLALDRWNDNKVLGQMGAVYSIRINDNQMRWITTRDWYRGKQPQKTVFFVTGGWWVCSSSILQDHDWPDKDILHRGGDVMLGELLRQNNYHYLNFRTGVRINADQFGKESASRRRGYDEKPVGS